MKKQTKYDKLKSKVNERQHRLEFLEEFKLATNKYAFMIEHPSIFSVNGNGGASKSSVLFPNGLQLQNVANVSATGSATFQSPLYSFNLPYKISFTISTIGNSNNYFGGIYVRDTITSPVPNGSATLPDQANGNLFMFGPNNANVTAAQLWRQTAAGSNTNFTTNINTTCGIPNAPLDGSYIWTIQEDLPNVNTVKINVYNGNQAISQSYFSFDPQMSGTQRDIGLFVGSSGAGQYNVTYTVVNTVAW